MKRRIIKLKIIERNIYRKLFQKMANKIIVKMEKSPTYEVFDMWYTLGIQLDNTASFKNIYLK